MLIFLLFAVAYIAIAAIISFLAGYLQDLRYPDTFAIAILWPVSLPIIGVIILLDFAGEAGYRLKKSKNNE